MKDSDPEFWKELTSKRPQDLAPDEEEAQPEDDELIDDDEMLMAGDDSDIPVPLIIEAMVDQSCPRGTVMRPDGTLKSGAEAKRFEDEVHLEEYGEERVQLQEEASNLGRGKCRKVANKHYMGFWRHDDNEASDEDF